MPARPSAGKRRRPRRSPLLPSNITQACHNAEARTIPRLAAESRPNPRVVSLLGSSLNKTALATLQSVHAARAQASQDGPDARPIKRKRQNVSGFAGRSAAVRHAAKGPQPLLHAPLVQFWQRRGLAEKTRARARLVEFERKPGLARFWAALAGAWLSGMVGRATFLTGCP